MTELQQSPDNSIRRAGFVVIGRNEGERLKDSLNSVMRHAPGSPIVYVDSDSIDGSSDYSRSLGIETVCLSTDRPFTAARSRNAGFERLLEVHPDLEFVQFMDGDCELIEGWIESALNVLSAEKDIGIVSGRLFEKYPDASIYNTIIDIEWDTPVGEASTVLGNFCVRTEAFKRVNGFTIDIIAAEDNDFCLRVRAAGYRILRLEPEMTWHDANIMRLSQWYKRSIRGGYGFANISHLHGDNPECHSRKQLYSIVFWGGIVPSIFVVSLLVNPAIAVGLVVIYALIIVRLVLKKIVQGNSVKIACVYSFLIYTGKIAEFLGVLRYWKNTVLVQNHNIIEYK